MSTPKKLLELGWKEKKKNWDSVNRTRVIEMYVGYVSGNQTKTPIGSWKELFFGFPYVGCVSSPVVGRKQNGKLPALSVFVCEFFAS